MKKTIGFASVFCISSGAMISSGLFVLPGLAFAKAGPVVFLSYFVAGLVALTTVLSLSELVTAMPKAGGDYYYVSRTFGQLFGTVSGLLSWLALSLKSAFAVIGISELIYLVSGVNLTVSALVLTVVFTGINLFGVKEAVRFQVALVIGLFAILAAFVLAGVQDVAMGRFEPFLSHGFNALFSTAGFVFVSFGGVLTTASIAGEIRNPARTVPAGLIGSTVAVTLLYALVTFVVVGLVPPEQLSSSLAPIALAARAVGGPVLYGAIMVASLLAFVTTANGGVLTASRYPIALSSDGMLPRFFGATSRRKGTPVAAIIGTGVLIGLAVTLKLDLLVKAASTVILLSNIFAHLSVIVMRESKLATYRPTYRAPLYPWLQILAIVAFTLLIIDMGIQPVLLSLLFVTAGVVLYFVRRNRADPASSALIHLVQRITNKALVTEGLQSELRSIVEDRDGIVRDEFDRAVEQACFLDIEEAVDVEALWERISTELSGCLPTQVHSRKLVGLLRERESQGSTVISDFVAIPHVILDGTQTFRVAFVRARDGIRFDDTHGGVHAVFLLIGTRDKRNLHLRALAAIAQVVQHREFEDQWLSARGLRELKDLFLLSARRRTGSGLSD